MFRFHEGESSVQDRAGEQQIAWRVGRDIDASIMPAAQVFLSQQCMLFVGSADASGQPWASVLFGRPGFASSSESGDQVCLALDGVSRQVGDPWWSNLVEGRRVALLALDFPARKRFRVNGELASVSATQVVIRVHEAYPNCPKYIQSRRLSSLQLEASESTPAESGDALDDSRIATITAADTFFIASQHAERGLDVSHRGGPPGFVRVLSPRRLQVPDYRGNSLFNTLGNLAVDDRAGIVVLRYDCSRAIQLVGRVILHFDHDDPDQRSGGTRRFWEFELENWRESSLGALLQWGPVEYSRFNPIAAPGTARS